MKYTTCGFAVDELEFLQHVPSRVLVAASSGKLDLNQLAREELAQRGLNQQGIWVGSSKAQLAMDDTQCQDARRANSMLDALLNSGASGRKMAIALMLLADAQKSTQRA
ncbi:hypothetical protein [Pseudacidovorax sp. RU35E]|jgi:hypothetical protein|uniref:hypothetical protein n=1 Tax=Pseudacidovorax sp. RU35E TaxID=1907403 RepID=UPI00117B5750|nr:hypothetical protein [Pseudacidovorax sp. RU35E]